MYPILPSNMLQRRKQTILTSTSAVKADMLHLTLACRLNNQGNTASAAVERSQIADMSFHARADIVCAPHTACGCSQDRPAHHIHMDEIAGLITAIHHNRIISFKMCMSRCFTTHAIVTAKHIGEAQNAMVGVA